MSPVDHDKPAENDMPCGGEHYKPDRQAKALQQTPRCLWCTQLSQWPSHGPCPGILDPEKAREYLATQAGDA